MLYFTKGIRKRNFLDVMLKNYVPRLYRTVERLNVRYLSCEEVNIRGNDQECGVYKEGRKMRKMEEDREKIGVVVRKGKSVGGRERGRGGKKEGKERKKGEKEKRRGEEKEWRGKREV